MKNKRLTLYILTSLSILTLCVTVVDGQYLKNRKPAKYKHYPSYGVVVKKIPASHSVIEISNKKYYYDGGVFYKAQKNDFVVCTAPIGARIRSLPQAHSIIVLKRRTYYYHYGTFYKKNILFDAYEVVEPVMGVRVDALPPGGTLKMIDGVDYYIIDNTYYKSVVDENGVEMFEVVISS